jgi:4-amino-4-deoxy-L-arabinose transferase-like glycosyltransferase
MPSALRSACFRYALTAIVVLAALVRLVRLDTLPPSLNWDEVSFGYNAYSILKTGRDEFGKFLPLYFRSLDDYKLPVYMYLTAGSEAVLGYNDFAVRFPSALAGILTVGMAFLLTRELLGGEPGNDRQRGRTGYAGFVIPLLAAFFVAISPWNIQYSRMAAEANVGLLFFVLGMYGLVRALRSGGWWPLIAVAGFGLAAYSYLSYRVLAAAVFPVAVVLLGKAILIRTARKHLVPAVILGGIIAVALAAELLWGGVHIRYTGANAFSDNQQYVINEREMTYDAIKGINIPRRLYHDTEWFATLTIVARGYLSHFSPDFLFFDSESKHHHAPDVGLLYLFMIPLIPVGMLMSRGRFGDKRAALLAAWLVVSPLAAAFTRDVPHAIRSLGMSIPFAVYGALGAYGIARKIRSYGKLPTYAGGFVAAVVVLLFTGQYWHQYAVHLPHDRSDKWGYGLGQLMRYVSDNHARYDKVLVSSKLPWPHSFYLYYAKVDPVRYLAAGGTKSGGWENNWNRYGNIEFRAFDTKKDKTTRNMLFVGLPSEFPDTVNPLYEVRTLDTKPAYVVVSGEDTATD